jgi:RNA-directed DNA polymerase
LDVLSFREGIQIPSAVATAVVKKTRKPWLKPWPRVIMKAYHPVSESLNATGPESGGEAEGNCVAARRGGEQPDAKEQSQTKVNSIRRTSAASLRGSGEACAKRDVRSRQRPGNDDLMADERGWSGNVSKEVWLKGESCADRTDEGELSGCAAVRAVVRAKKSGNADGAKGGREANASSERVSETPPARVPPRADKPAGEDLWEYHKAERGVWSEKMLIALERGVKGGRWFSLMDKVMAEHTLSLAWEKVRSNAGACGVDNITVARFNKDKQSRLLAVNKQLGNGCYQPKPVKRVWIPKPGKKNEKRPLGIPAVKDRVVQQALRMVLEPIYERRFAEHSYGFRPGRSCHDALRRVNGQLVGGYHHVVDIDIKGYFDTINQERLLKLLAEDVADGAVIALIKQLLKSGVLEEDGELKQTDTGTPQGGVISPLLSNLYLDKLDHRMEGAGYAMTRYADDMVMLCRTAEEAEAALRSVRAWMEEVELTLHPEKTRIVDMSKPEAHFDFLGYRFKRSRRGEILKLARPKSVAKIKEGVRKWTKRCNGQAMEEIIRLINPRLRGWFGYFKQAHRNVHRSLDGWVRMRLRSIYRKRQKKRGRGRGSDHHRWPNRHFADLGLFSLEEAKAEAISLHNGGKR